MLDIYINSMNSINNTDDKSFDDALIKKLKDKKLPNNQIEKFYGLSDAWYLQRKINPMAQYKNTYVLLDTNNLAPELSSETKFGWRIINNTIYENGTVSMAVNTRDLIGMRIYSFVMNLIAPVGEIGKNYVNNVVNINNSFNILIHEFSGQSFIGKDGIKFHFDLYPNLMNVSDPSTIVAPVVVGYPTCVPTEAYYEFSTKNKGGGWFWFMNPITEFNTITISIRNPFDLVKLNNNIRTLIPLQLIYLAEKRE